MARSTALSPRKKPRQERSRQTVAAILTGAAQVLERRGYAGATTDAIAERKNPSIRFACLPRTPKIYFLKD